MNVGLILNLLKELNKSILCVPLARIILFHSTSSINLVTCTNLIFFLSHTPKITLNCKKDHLSPTRLLYNANF